MPNTPITIFVDGKAIQARKGAMLIEATDAAGIHIPRFCYHKKLSVAANCRMCLVEVEKAKGPVPACATPVMDGMKVYTRSKLALSAQKATMEFLLINHPLDCPICDQGGECELQDIAMGYGSDVSRYTEAKRAVKDKDIGPLIQTDMTRCIHCTRCVRFGEEVAGMRELGGIGRGEHMTIGTYVERTVQSELSGNIIDLCPVGALTSKPFRYSARAWELRQYDSIAPHDALGSNIHLHVLGNTVKRVVPKENEAINEVWLSDRDRFSYEGLNSPERMEKPMIKVNGQWQETDWQTALDFTVQGLKKIPGDQIGALASPTCTVEEMYLLQKLMRGIGCHNIDHRLRQADFRDQEELPEFPWLGQKVEELEDLDAALIIGSNIREEIPLINYRFHKAVDHGGEFFIVNSADFNFNWQAVGRLIQSPSATERVLAGIVKALIGGEEADPAVHTLLQGIEPTREQQIIATSLASAQHSGVFLGQIAASNPNASKLRALAGLIAEYADSKLGYFPEAANSCGAWLAGVLPHRGPGGRPCEEQGLNARAMFENGLKGYFLLGTEPELDSLTSVAADQSLTAADFVVSVFPFRSEKMMAYADVLLPMALFAETSGTFVNLEGTWQSFNGAVKPRGDARPAWKILRVLGNQFELEGFDYTSSDEVLKEVRRQCRGITPDNRGKWSLPEQIGSEEQGIELMFDTPIYFTDPLVRRAPALQAMEDVHESVLHVHPSLADTLKVNDGDTIRIRQDNHMIELKSCIDDRLSPTCALWRRGYQPEPDFGIRPGQFTLEKVE